MKEWLIIFGQKLINLTNKVEMWQLKRDRGNTSKTFIFSIGFYMHCKHYRKIGQNRPPKMVGYEGYRSVITIKQTVGGGRLCRLVVFNSYNRPYMWSIICFCVLRIMVPRDATCHHVMTGVTPRQIGFELLSYSERK